MKMHNSIQNEGSAMLELIRPSDGDITVLYTWKQEERHHELYSCRPVNPLGTYEEFFSKVKSRLEDPERIHRILRNTGTHELLGEAKGFDFNPRNHSLEFGYYLPARNRHKGYGEMMIRLFLDEVFTHSGWELNKLYATTSGNNEASKGVLEKIGFRIDGKNREHYWIDGERYDQVIYSLLRTEWDRYEAAKCGDA
jgi:ribosomal-protein-alanine N-acetyltransferase